MERHYYHISIACCILVIRLALPGVVSAALVDYQCDLLAYWGFEEGVGSTTADQVGPNTGVFHGTEGTDIIWSTSTNPILGHSNYALRFNGTGDKGGWVDVGNVVGLDAATAAGSFSISLWMKGGNYDKDFPSPISKRDTLSTMDWQLFINNNSAEQNPDLKLRFTIGSGHPQQNLLHNTPPTSDESTWHHVAITKDGTLYTMYLDGVPATRNETKVIDGGDRVIIGALQPSADHNNLWQFFNGYIDDVAIWKSALSQAEINELLSGISPKSESTNCIPEPASLLVWSLLGFVGIGIFRYRKRRS
jgi:hypothetical protein